MPCLPVPLTADATHMIIPCMQVDLAYGTRLCGLRHERFGLYTTERVTSMLLSITSSLRLARNYAARMLRAPFDLVLLARHDVYFFRPLELAAVDPDAFTTAPWCAWAFERDDGDGKGVGVKGVGSKAGGVETSGRAPKPALSTPAPQKEAVPKAQRAATKAEDPNLGRCGTLSMSTSAESGVIDLFFLGGQTLLEYIFGSMQLARMMRYQRR